MSFLRHACGVVLWRALAAALVAVLGFVALPAHAGAKRKPSVLIVYAPTTPGSSDVQAKLMSSGEFAKVDIFQTNVPSSLATFRNYDAILLYNAAVRFSPAGDTLLGNNLADYIDAGGGVVAMGCATATAMYSPEGRYADQYRVMNYNYVILAPNTINPASITNSNHPILIGVNALTVGAANSRNSAFSGYPGSTVIVRYSDGPALVVEGVRPGRVDLNFYPVSSDALAESWETNTDGLKLMVNSLLYVMRPRVLLVAADEDDYVADVKSKLTATDSNGTGPVVGIVDTFHADLATPTLDQLQQYDAVLTWSNSGYFNSTALGNVLADYVDAGGGVVTALYANVSSVSTARISGRWITGGYEIIPGGSGIAIAGSWGYGGSAYPNHPIAVSAQGFYGGQTSLRPNTTGLNPFGLKVATWGDGKTLAAVSTKFPNRAELGFFPPSGAVHPLSWPVSSHGEKMTGTALVYVCKPYIGCLSADTLNASDPKAKLIASRRFSGVLGIDAAGSTPSLATLSPLSAMLIWTNEPANNRASLGNVLADYIDAGGGGVSAVFGNTVSPPPVTGRWVTDGYEIVPSPLANALQGGSPILGTVLEPDHSIARFVRKFGGGVNWRVSGSPLLRGRRIMNWSDGTMLASVHTFRKRADLGMFPPSTGIYASGWNQRTDGTWLMANALEWAVRSRPCPGDFNGDGVVDDTDFTMFVGYYDTLVDPRGDLTGDGLTEDADFSKFVGSYNDLVCP